MRRLLLGMGALLAVSAALFAASGAGAVSTVRVGTLVVHADGGFEPEALPRRTYAPIHFQGYGEIKTTNGSIPPAAQHLKLELDRDGKLTTDGLSVCQPSQLEGVGTPLARRRCGKAIVGEGEVGAVVDLAGFGRVDLRVPLTVFNGPRRGGDPTSILHAQAPFPISETYVVVVPIERVHNGPYGYRVEFDVPQIAGGLGSLTYIGGKVGRFYRFHGSKRSYVSARCRDYILQTQGYVSFADGNVIYGSLFKTCRPKD